MLDTSRSFLTISLVCGRRTHLRNVCRSAADVGALLNGTSVAEQLVNIQAEYVPLTTEQINSVY